MSSYKVTTTIIDTNYYGDCYISSSSTATTLQLYDDDAEQVFFFIYITWCVFISLSLRRDDRCLAKIRTLLA